MDWIRQFVRNRTKPPDYAAKTLKAYRLGVKAGGSIEGVKILVSEDSCPACRAVGERIYAPQEAPLLPLIDCTHTRGCRCAYTLVMKTD